MAILMPHQHRQLPRQRRSSGNELWKTSGM